MKGKDLGVSTWPPDTWKIGGGTIWGWFSYDPDLNLLYYGTSNPGPWNSNQRPGDNLWTTTLFARDPDSGVGCHAANGGGGMGPALSEGRFIYGSNPANLFLSIYQGRPNGMPAWGEILPESTIWEDCRLRPEHRSCAERDIWRDNLENAAIPSCRADAVGVPANAESVELHEPLQQRPKAGGRVSSYGFGRARDAVDCGLCGIRALQPGRRRADGLPARRRPHERQNPAADTSVAARLRRRRAGRNRRKTAWPPIQQVGPLLEVMGCSDPHDDADA